MGRRSQVKSFVCLPTPRVNSVYHAFSYNTQPSTGVNHQYLNVAVLPKKLWWHEASQVGPFENSYPNLAINSCIRFCLMTRNKRKWISNNTLPFQGHHPFIPKNLERVFWTNVCTASSWCVVLKHARPPRLDLFFWTFFAPPFAECAQRSSLNPGSKADSKMSVPCSKNWMPLANHLTTSQCL